MVDWLYSNIIKQVITSEDRQGVDDFLDGLRIVLDCMDECICEGYQFDTDDTQRIIEIVGVLERHRLSLETAMNLSDRRKLRANERGRSMG